MPQMSPTSAFGKLRPMLLVFLIALIAAVAAQDPKCSSSPLPNDYGWCDCSTNGEVQIVYLKITPDNRGSIPKGENLTIEFSLKDIATYPITAGSIIVNAKLGPVTIFDKTLDLCSQVKHYEPCPWAPGMTKTMKINEVIPKSAPGGTYKATATIVDQQKKQMVCIQAQFKVA